MQNRLEQLNITYHADQDRLLLKVNSGDVGEYRIWLTRRYTEILGNILAEIMEKLGGMQNIASHQDTISHLKGGAFDQEYAFLDSNMPGQDLPLGSEGILGFRINYGRDHAGTVQLQLLPEQGAGLNLSLNRTMLFLMFNLLEQAVVKADWKLQLPQQHRDPVH